jgi:ABC-type multidrug transport system ATPase subunit
MKDPVIQAREFRKTYGNLVAVDGISFDGREDKICGLLEPKGAGKSPPMRVLAAVTNPTEGQMTRNRAHIARPANEVSQALD